MFKKLTLLALFGAATQAISLKHKVAVKQDDIPSPQEIVAMIDGDNDGFITKKEFTGFMGNIFGGIVEAVDTDKDGKLSTAEAIAGLESLME